MQFAGMQLLKEAGKYFHAKEIAGRPIEAGVRMYDGDLFEMKEQQIER